MAPQGHVATFQSASPPLVDASPVSRPAVAHLFDLHAAGLYRLAIAMLHDPAAAEDVVQDTFLKLLSHVGGGGALPNAKGWLFTVAAHACRDRQRRGRRWLPWSAALDRRVANEPPGLMDDRAVVLDALRALGHRDRLLVTLKAQGLTYEEIGAAAHVRTTSVGRLLARALDRLSRELAAREEIRP